MLQVTMVRDINHVFISTDRDEIEIILASLGIEEINPMEEETTYEEDGTLELHWGEEILDPLDLKCKCTTPLIYSALATTCLRCKKQLD